MSQPPEMLFAPEKLHNKIHQINSDKLIVLGLMTLNSFGLPHNFLAQGQPGTGMTTAEKAIAILALGSAIALLVFSYISISAGNKK